MVALYNLQKEEIYFNNFEVDHNIFIKDLSQHSNLTTFWKYKINGIDYYVPNYGYLLLIDTNFAHIQSAPHPFKFDKTKIKYKSTKPTTIDAVIVTFILIS